MRSWHGRGLLRVAGQGNVVILGSKRCPETLAIREFLIRDGHPFGYLDLEADTIAQEMLDRFELGASDIPVVFCNGEILRDPTPRRIAETLGFNADIGDFEIKDLVVVGAGPAGLAAAVYAASEGLDVLVIERLAPGGQAGSSSKIENYLGFPTGLSGQELAMRAIAQAEKFGARIMVARSVERLDRSEQHYKITLDDGQQIGTRAIVLATGAQIQQATHFEPRCLRRPWHLLQRYVHGSPTLRRRKSGGRRRRKTQPDKLRCSFRKIPQESSCSSRGPRVGSNDVPLSYSEN